MKKLLTLALTGLFAVGTIGNVVGCKKKEDKKTEEKKTDEKKTE